MKDLVRIRKIPFLVLLALLTGLPALGGCQERSPSSPASVEPGPTIAAKPCPLPCWYGITPGKTSIEESLNILKTLPGVYIPDKGIKESGGRIKEIYWRGGYPKIWWYSSKRIITRNRLVAEEGVVTRIVLELAVTDTLSLGEVVERYGPPEGYKTYYILPIEDEAAEWSVIFFCPQQGMTIEAAAPRERYGDVTADLEVTRLILYVPITMEEYYRRIDRPYPDPCLKEWQGFHRGEKPCPAP